MKEGGKRQAGAPGGRLGRIIWGDAYEIRSGLTAEDKIAFPYGKEVKEGAEDGSDQRSKRILEGRYTLRILDYHFRDAGTTRCVPSLAMLGIIIGIASIISIVSTIKGTNEQIKQNLVGAGNNISGCGKLYHRRRQGKLYMDEEQQKYFP